MGRGLRPSLIHKKRIDVRQGCALYLPCIRYNEARAFDDREGKVHMYVLKWCKMVLIFEEGNANTLDIISFPPSGSVFVPLLLFFYLELEGDIAAIQGQKI